MNIALFGYGKMGKTIETIALERGHTITLRLDSKNAGELNPALLKKADVVIEFTTPASVLKNIDTCLNLNIPIVVGTTGWYEKLNNVKRTIKDKNGALLYASNFSVGVNLFFELNKKLAQLMKRHTAYKVNIREVHHIQKLDAPSGTAITLANDILLEDSSKTTWVNRASDNKNELPIISERTDRVPGTHTVSYASDIDTIDITHTAHNRQGFALGAVLAAEWIVGKKGIFTMQDVLEN